MSNDNITRLPVSPGPRAIGAVVQNVVAAVSVPSDMQMSGHHSQAAAFHEAMSRAFMMQDEIEQGKREGELDPYWEKQYAIELGNAAVALQKMPARWAAILEAELPRPSGDAA